MNFNHISFISIGWCVLSCQIYSFYSSNPALNEDKKTFGHTQLILNNGTVMCKIRLILTSGEMIFSKVNR